MTLTHKRKGAILQRDDGYGGLQTIINRQQAYFRILYKPEFQYTEFLPLEVYLPEGRFLLINIYCPHREKFKKEKNEVIKCLINLKQYEMTHFIIIAGDFNYYLQQEKEIASQYTFIQYDHKTRVQKNQIDHILVPKSQQKYSNQGFVVRQKLSDHDLIFFNFPNLANQQIESQFIRISKAETQKELDFFSALNEKDLEDKLKMLIPKRGSHYHKYIQRGMLHQASKFSKKQVITDILKEELYLTKLKRPFQIITSLLKGRQSEIVWALEDEDGQIIAQPEKVQDKLIYQWLGIVGENEKPENEYGFNLMWRNHDSSNIWWMEDIIQRVNFYKAMGPDGISMLAFRKDLKEFYCEGNRIWWDNLRDNPYLNLYSSKFRHGEKLLKYLNRFYYRNRKEFLFGDYEKLTSIIGEPAEFKMVALNKNYPNIGKINQFRPIIVQNQIWKFYEGKFLTKLEDIKERIENLENFGFRRSIGCAMGTRRLIRTIQVYSKEKTKYSEFAIINLDLSNAYDTVNRIIMANILRKKVRERGLHELDILEIERMWEQIHITTSDGKKHYTKNGLPQGSILSPTLFVIYMDEVTHNIKKAYYYNLQLAGLEQEEVENIYLRTHFSIYADDMNIIVPQCSMGILIAVIEEMLIEFNLKLNKNKSTITMNKQNLRRWNKKDYQLNEKGKLSQWKDYPVIKEFKYLGIWMNNKGNIKEHMERLKNKVNRLSGILRWQVKDLNLRQRILAWQTYIRPYFLQLSYIVQTQTKGMQNQYWAICLSSFKKTTSLKKSTNLRFAYDLIDFKLTPNENQMDEIDKQIIERIQGRPEYYNTKLEQLGNEYFYKQSEKLNQQYWLEKFEQENEKSNIKKLSEGIDLVPLRNWNPVFVYYQNIYNCTCTKEIKYDPKGRQIGQRNLDFYHVLKHLNEKHKNIKPSFSHLFFKLVSRKEPYTLIKTHVKKWKKLGKKKKMEICVPLSYKWLINEEEINMNGKGITKIPFSWDLFSTTQKQACPTSEYNYMKKKALGAVRWILNEIEEEGLYLLDLAMKEKGHQSMKIQRGMGNLQEFQKKLEFYNLEDLKKEKKQSIKRV